MVNKVPILAHQAVYGVGQKFLLVFHLPAFSCFLPVTIFLKYDYLIACRQDTENLLVLIEKSAVKFSPTEIFHHRGSRKPSPHYRSILRKPEETSEIPSKVFNAFDCIRLLDGSLLSIVPSARLNCAQSSWLSFNLALWAWQEKRSVIGAAERHVSTRRWVAAELEHRGRDAHHWVLTAKMGP